MHPLYFNLREHHPFLVFQAVPVVLCLLFYLVFLQDLVLLEFHLLLLLLEVQVLLVFPQDLVVLSDHDLLTLLSNQEVRVDLDYQEIQEGLEDL